MNNHTSLWAAGVLVLTLVACTNKTLDGGSAKTDGGDGSSSSGGTPGEDATSSGDRELGQGCDDDGQCVSGLTCRQNYVADQCTAQKTCTKVCAGDADCKALSSKAMCFEGCTKEMICMLTSL